MPVKIRKVTSKVNNEDNDDESESIDTVPLVSATISGNSGQETVVKYLKLSGIVLLITIAIILGFQQLYQRNNNKLLTTVNNEAGQDNELEKKFINKMANNDETVMCIDVKKEKIYTKEELLHYVKPPKILLAFLGIVYDVTDAKYYQPSGSYSFFAGKDGTRAFLTGEFTVEELRDDISDLDDSYFSGIESWLNLYNDKYKRMGVVQGAYYDANGCPTYKHTLVQLKLNNAKKTLQADNDEQSRFPPCNSEWNNNKNEGRVWCSTRSGGIQRDWSGRPRLMYSLANKNWRCACVKDDTDVGEDFCDKQSQQQQTQTIHTKPKVEYGDNGDDANCLFKHYPDCNVNANECVIRD